VAYFMLECYAGADPEAARVARWPAVPGIRSWKLGSRFAVPVPQPLQFELDPNYGSRLLPLYNSTILLMQRRLLDAFQAAGVSNLDVYNASILDPRTKQAHTQHVAVNVIGMISAADMAKSKIDPNVPDRMISTDFQSVVIDEKKPRDALFFRLAENVSAIVVHERVARQIRTTEYPGLTFVPPEQWMG